MDERGSYIKRDEKSGLGLAPFSHRQNSTAVLVEESLFAGTVADFQGVDPIVFRDPLRTVQYDSTQLNDPDFVGSFDYGVKTQNILLVTFFLTFKLTIFLIHHHAF